MKKNKRKIQRQLWAALLLIFCFAGLFIRKASAFSLPMNANVYTQQMKVNGKVRSGVNGSTLPGVTVEVKGSQIVTVTDAEGNFEIVVPEGNAVLVFTFMGFKPKEVALNNRQTLEVSLEYDVESLDEVVVIGYGTVEKKDLTGAVSSLKGDDVAQRGTVNPLQALQGQMAGVNISASSGRAGTGYDIQIRGQNSLAGGSPLYVVDGVIVGGIDFLNPQDIERIDVLKDASSTAIYGSRGSNGVVIVTTKNGSGVKGVTTISYDGYMGIRENARMPDFMSGDEWWKYRQNAYITGVLQSGKPYDETIGGVEKSPLLAKRLANKEYTFWPGYFLQTGLQTNHWLTVSGTSQNNMSYVLGAGYQEEKGNLAKEYYKRYNFKASVDHKISEKWSAGTSFNLSLAEIERGSDLAVTNSYRMSPLVTPYDTTGTELLFQPAKYAGISFTSSVNPLWELKDSENNTRRAFAVGQVYLQYSPLSWIDVRSSFAPRFKMERNGRYWGSHTESRKLKDPSASTSRVESLSYIWDNQVTLRKKYGDHNFNLLGLYSLFYERNEGDNINVENLPFNSLFYNLGSATDLLSVGSNFSKITMISYLARLNYSYKGRYLLTLSNRWDGSSKLADDYKWNAFPSAAAAWRLSEEPFMKNVGFLDELKLRASYGFTGNNNISPYETQVLSSNQTYYDFGGNLAKGFAPSGIVNSRLTWEKTREVDLGLDFALFRRRLSGAIDYYNKLSENLLLDRELPMESGWGELVDNVGSVRNKGVELSLNSVNVNKDGFYWSTSLTFAKNKNEIVELLNGNQDLVGNQWFIGQPIDVNYTYVFDGIWQEGDDVKFGQSVGEARVKDLNGDGIIGPEDRKIIGSPFPSWTGGLSTQFRYKGFDLSVSLYTRQGVQVYSPFHAEFTNLNDRGRAKLDVSYYMPENHVTGSSSSNSYPQPKNIGRFWSDVGYYKDASYTKIQNIVLGYNFPATLLQKAGIKMTRLYMNVQNPFVWTKYTGFDPEWANSSLNSTGNSFITYQFGVNLKF